MNKDIKNTVLIMELLSGRLLHDFANSMSGIMSSVEEFETGDKNDADAQKDAFSLLKESSDDLMSKHKVMKQAYSSSGDNSSFDLTKSNIKNYLKKK
ncbi:hypothetical protein [Wolbachia endosymbiont of Folsomia candida]|uniref:hypothetical protein n=1 Tax=Wolbachia endosymbiont of Folsomia candida TaxID=169402 RepID=UPI000B26CB5F|nr:hypothetical protein [Wolbachia endosymbiont of Folsomia candida]APR98769.1 hypothetical protein ASM33_06050 [Wolbachia endosymbiont of Folsomia candida]